MENSEANPESTQATILQILDGILDPEIPVISIVELGMVRQAWVEDDKIHVSIAPTFSGCPALELIQEQIRSSLNEAGFPTIDIEIVYSPPWSSDDISPPGRQKLKSFGISPPVYHQGLIQIALQEPVVCPYCDSTDTTLKNSFGSTRCRAIYYCNHCKQPFEQFKPI